MVVGRLKRPRCSSQWRCTAAVIAASSKSLPCVGYDLQAYMCSLARGTFEGTRSAAPFVFVTEDTSAPNYV
jgi:hypothetical protein